MGNLKLDCDSFSCSCSYCNWNSGIFWAYDERKTTIRVAPKTKSQGANIGQIKWSNTENITHVPVGIIYLQVGANLI
jgi:hypothetical protein